MEHRDDSNNNNNNKIYTEILLCVVCTDIQTSNDRSSMLCSVDKTNSFLVPFSSTVCAHYTYIMKITVIKMKN